MKWFKASAWIISLLAVLAIGAGVAGWIMMRGTPSWYKPKIFTEEERRRNSAAVENKLNNLTNTFRKRNAAEYLANHPDVKIDTAQAKRLQQQNSEAPVQIDFTDDELNAFFDKWADFQNRRAMFDQYVESPRIILENNQLILAARVKELDLVVSMQFEPHIDAEGRLHMDLKRVLGGVLPLPDSMWLKQRHGLESVLKKKMPEYQRLADISADGLANSAMGSAAMNQMLLATLSNESSNGVIFVPASIEKLAPSIPVKITSVSIKDHTLSITALQMSAAERQQLLEEVRTYSADTEPPADPAERK